MTCCTMPARSQGELYAQRAAAHLERDTHRCVFVRGLIPEVEVEVEVECDVRKWLLQRLNGLYCGLQLNNTPPLPSMARDDVDGLNALGTVKALIKATGLNPHLSVYGWPFCLDDADAAGGGSA